MEAIRTFNQDSQEYKTLEAFCKECNQYLSKLHPNAHLEMNRGLFDGGQDRWWDSPISVVNGEEWWSLCPADQEEILKNNFYENDDGTVRFPSWSVSEIVNKVVGMIMINSVR